MAKESCSQLPMVHGALGTDGDQSMRFAVDLFVESMTIRRLSRGRIACRGELCQGGFVKARKARVNGTKKTIKLLVRSIRVERSPVVGRTKLGSMEV